MFIYEIGSLNQRQTPTVSWQNTTSVSAFVLGVKVWPKIDCLIDCPMKKQIVIYTLQLLGTSSLSPRKSSFKVKTHQNPLKPLGNQGAKYFNTKTIIVKFTAVCGMTHALLSVKQCNISYIIKGWVIKPWQSKENYVGEKYFDTIYVMVDVVFFKTSLLHRLNHTLKTSIQQVKQNWVQ